MKRLFCILLLLALSLSACTEAGEDGSSGGSSGGSSSTAAGTASDIAKDASELFTDRDYNDDYAEDGSVHITLNGDSAEADSDAVRISGTIVTVKMCIRDRCWIKASKISEWTMWICTFAICGITIRRFTTLWRA